MNVVANRSTEPVSKAQKQQFDTKKKETRGVVKQN